MSQPESKREISRERLIHELIMAKAQILHAKYLLSYQMNIPELSSERYADQARREVEKLLIADQS